MLNKRQGRGFSLIELMITVVIISVLSAIVYPLYQKQTQKARRVEAKSTLMGIALAQERQLTQAGAYASAAGLDDEYTELIARMSDRNDDGNPDYYAITVTATSTSFTVQAVAQGVQLSDTDCRNYSVNQLGLRLAEDSDGDDNSMVCW